MSLNPPYTLVESQEALHDLANFLDGVYGCAVDTEADSMHHYSVRLCLIQISAGGRNYIVDPLAGLDMNPLWKAKGMADLVLHGADYDLRMLQNTFGFAPQKVFDTMIAAKFLGEEHIGLAHLVQKQFGISLAKSNQKADWTIRPLPDGMRQYAILDTYFLADIEEELVKRLEAEGKLEWVEETCAHLLQQTQSEPFMESKEEAWRIRGSNKLYPEELVFLKTIFEWREKEAERMDRPPFKVLNPDVMLDLARECAYITPDIRVDRLPRLPRNFTGDRLKSFLEALHGAAQIPEEQWPQREKKIWTRPLSPDSHRLEHFREIRDKIAMKYGLDPSLLANRQQLVALSLKGSSEELRTNSHCLNWQWNLLAPAFGLA
ncbi:MAG TPA: HRDC domain-containing protein [Fibrobacteraceae bacterium]|nr:HRDC domain-containing protein [Fibrobacteraceae bacterium]